VTKLLGTAFLGRSGTAEQAMPGVAQKASAVQMLDVWLCGSSEAVVQILDARLRRFWKPAAQMLDSPLRRRWERSRRERAGSSTQAPLMDS
jgi:hypothetical protein